MSLTLSEVADRCAAWLGSASDHAFALATAGRCADASSSALVGTLIDSLQLGVLVEDEARCVRYVNPVLLRDFGLAGRPDAVLGADCRRLARSIGACFADPAAFVSGLDRVVAAGVPVRGEELLLADGRVLERDYVPIVVGGDRQGHLWQYRDITHRKRAERDLEAQNEELRAIDRMKDEFVALVSHELRTPLTSILGYLDLLLEDRGALPGEQGSFLEVVDRNARRLLRLVNDLLFVAQIDAGALTLESAPVDLREVATECVQAHAPEAAAHGVTLGLDCPARVVVDGDRARLGQVVDNLVANAIKFTPERGAVTLRARAGASAVLEVTDTGVGIPQDEQARLFERFFRSSAARSNHVPGSGLGLAIARAIVDGHGGRIEVVSVVGRGTTMRVVLPLYGAAGAPAPLPPALVRELTPERGGVG